MQTFRRCKVLLLLAAGGLVGVPAFAHAQSAMGQLNNATSGSQSTGTTFDGGNTPTDAYPSGGTAEPPAVSSGTVSNPDSH